jgi:hypothetical protein
MDCAVLCLTKIARCGATLENGNFCLQALVQVSIHPQEARQNEKDAQEALYSLLIVVIAIIGTTTGYSIVATL